MTELTPADVAAYRANRFPEFKRSRDSEWWRGPCPVHQGARRDSFAFHGETGQAVCHSQCGRGWDIPALEQQLSGSDFATAVRSIERIIGRDLLTTTNGNANRRIVAEYDYVDENGKLLFQVVRFDPKDFRQRQPDGLGGWIWNVKGVRLVPYRLPEVLAANEVFIVEGERDVHTLEKLGFVATCNPMGAGKWRDDYAQHFRGKTVFVIPDADEPGRKHATAVCRSLQGVAASVRLVTLPKEKDVSDWVALGGDAGQLRELAEAATGGSATAEVSLDTGVMVSATAEVTPLVLDRADPLANARRFLADEFTTDNRQTLHHHRDEFYGWVRSHYPRIDEANLRARLYEYLEAAKISYRGELRPFKPTTRRVSETLDALRAAAHLSTEITAPAWLEQVCDLPPNEIVPCCNGLLHFPEMELLGHDSDYFCTSALPVAFDPFAPEPAEWVAFLASVWGDDTEAIQTLGEAFGYWLTSDTRQQKIFLLVGPKRAGKGTIARVLTALLGRENVAGPTLGSLSANFGLSPLIGKPLAIVSDARLSGRSDQAVIVERLLSISGEDVLTVDRKYREPWTGTLPTRFLLLTNELPRLADASGAMASRFVVLTMRNSFYGREDTELFERLRGELPGILRWSVDGLQRLRERGRFVQPASSAEAIRELEDLGSPVGAFVRDRCEVGPGLSTTVDDLYQAWQAWCRDQGREHAGTKARFGRDLRAAVPGIVAKQRREAYQVIRVYEGISLT